jgi:alcohol dehydrogenase class IV
MALTVPAFSLGRLPRVLFGPGAAARLPELAERLGRHALVVTGTRSFRAMPQWAALTAGLRERGIARADLTVSGEPSPKLVDEAVAMLRNEKVDVVLGIGGGSALDAAKAIAGLLRPGNSVMDHLEGVGPEAPYRGPAVPFIAVPTTAGTGSEATANAVLSVRGRDGFKKSFRDEKLVAEFAVVDPDLLSTCPREVIAADGMDALTQLLESFVSSRATPVTDALVRSGLAGAREALLSWHAAEGAVDAARARMAYAALLSGIALAQAGLGSVHGLASPIGAFFPVPHGVVCGTLLAAATRANLRALRSRADGSPALAKYAEAGRLLSGEARLSDEEARRALVAMLDEATHALQLPRLGAYGVGAADLKGIVAGSRGSSMKTNPVVLTDEEIAAIVAERL